jgi:hypothetical protein
VRHGVDGVVLSEPTSDAISETIMSCLQDPAKLERFSQAITGPERFAMPVLAKRLLTLFGE